MSAMYAAAFTAVVVPLLGQIASRIRSPTKTSQGGSYEDKPIWTTWIENVVQAFAGRRPDDQFERDRHDEPNDSKAGSEKVVEPQQPPMQSWPPPDSLLSQRRELDLQQSVIESAVSRIPRQNHIFPEGIDSGPRMMEMLRAYLGTATHYSSAPLAQTYPENRGLPTEPWPSSDRYQSRANDIVPDLTEPRRIPNRSQLPQQQAYGAISPIRRDTDPVGDKRSRSNAGKDSITEGRSLKLNDQVPFRQQDFFEKPLQPPGRDNPAKDSGQAQDYLGGRYHPESGTRQTEESRYRSHIRTDGRRRDEDSYEEGYNRKSEQSSRDAPPSDRRQDRGQRSTGRRDRSYYNEEGSISSRHRDRDYRRRRYEESDDGYDRVYGKETRKRHRDRRQRSEDIVERDSDREHRDRHRYHSPERSDDNKDHNSRGGNHTNVVVNVGVAPTETPAVEASQAITPPLQDLPIIRDVIPIAEVNPVHDPLVDPGEAQQAQRREAARVRQERYQAAMRGPSSRKASLEISPATDVEPANGNNPTPIPEKERAIETNTSPLNPAAPIPPVNVGRDESIESESVREPGTDHQTLETSKSSDSAQSSGTAHTLRGPGKKRKPELPSIETHTHETAEPSSVKRDSVLQTSPARPGHPAHQTTPKDWEASPNAPSPEAHKNGRQPDLRSPLDQGQGSEPTSPASTSQRRSRRFRDSSNSIRHHLETQGLSASDSGHPISPLHSASFPRSAARQRQESEQRGDSDTETLSINEPARTVADRVSQTNPGRPRGRRRRQRVAREVLEYSSTLKAHNVRGPKSLARLIKLALKSSPKVTFLMVVVWVTYVAGIVYFGNQVTALEQLTSTFVQPVRRGPEDEIAASSTFSPLDSFEKDTQLLIILNLWHASIWLILLFLIDYIWRSIPDPNQDQRHQVWFNRLGFKSLARIALTFAPMAVYLFLGGRQLTSCAYLLNDPQAIAWSMWPDVALTWPQLSEAAITRTTATSAIGTGKDDVDGMQLLAVSAFFWGTGIPAFLYTIRRIRYPGLRSKRRLISKVRKESLV